MALHITIVGRGEFAKAIAKRCGEEKIAYSFWEDKRDSKKTIILYCGSSRLFKDVTTFCKATKTPLVLLSTNVPIPKRTTFPFYFIPNTSSEVRTFIKSVSEYAAKTKYTKVSILESHQKSKKDISGTAKLIAKKLNKSTDIIRSIRNQKDQRKLGIPQKYLEGHAYHKISFIHLGVTTDFSVLVLGRATYAKGAIEIAKGILKGTFSSDLL